MKITLAQLKISKDINENRDKILSVLNKALPKEWIVFPEGMLTGYYPKDSEFLPKINRNKLKSAEKEIRSVVEQKDITVILGSIIFDTEGAYNATLIFHGNSIEAYYKCNLSLPDRHHFAQGKVLKPFQVENITFGVQMCRESAFPEQWTFLKKKDVKMVIHTNNAVEEYDGKRKNLLLARAQENQYFVVSVNTVTDTSPLSSMVVNPWGNLVYEAPLHEENVRSLEIDLSEVKNDYLEQKREDLVETIGKA